MHSHKLLKERERRGIQMNKKEGKEDRIPSLFPSFSLIKEERKEGKRQLGHKEGNQWKKDRKKETFRRKTKERKSIEKGRKRGKVARKKARKGR